MTSPIASREHNDAKFTFFRGGGSTNYAGDGYLTLDLDGQPRTFNVWVSANDPPSGSTVNFVSGSGQASNGTFPHFGLQRVSLGI